MQRREAELGLRFDPHQADYVEAPSRLDGVIEKCRLSYARFALQHEDGAHAIARCLKEAINLAALILAAHKQVMAVRQDPPVGGGTGTSPLVTDRITSAWADLHTFPI
jgi:DNA-nicking Smr family endonuclease